MVSRFLLISSLPKAKVLTTPIVAKIGSTLVYKTTVASGFTLIYLFKGVKPGHVMPLC